jgi:8-oxo-dGTP pyrophosphatase MutT (NUDIX family)
MLDVKLGREGPTPKDAATILCVRDSVAGLEVLCVERAKASGFLGGAVVFPGGKVDASDADPQFAACREAFEEAGILLHRGATLPEAERRALRERLAKGEPFGALLAERGIELARDALVTFARWVTPVVEARRFDTHFFLAPAPPEQEAVHDAHETTSAFWGTPRSIIDRFERGECQLFPPTHRSLEVLDMSSTVADALRAAMQAPLDPICPELVRQATEGGTETMALVLPGDPEHSIKEMRVMGRSRYVLRGERWLPEAAPHRPSR